MERSGLDLIRDTSFRTYSEQEHTGALIFLSLTKWPGLCLVVDCRCVCKALDTVSKGVVAIKRIEDLFKSKILALRILREISILRRLSHPNIIRLVNVVKPPPIPVKIKSFFVILEYGGMDLRMLVSNRTFHEYLSFLCKSSQFLFADELLVRLESIGI